MLICLQPRHDFSAEDAAELVCCSCCGMKLRCCRSRLDLVGKGAKGRGLELMLSPCDKTVTLREGERTVIIYN